MSVNYCRYTPLLDHLVLARCYRIKKNFEFLETELSDVAGDFGMIVNGGMVSGLSLDRRLNSIY